MADSFCVYLQIGLPKEDTLLYTTIGLEFPRILSHMTPKVLNYLLIRHQTLKIASIKHHSNSKCGYALNLMNKECREETISIILVRNAASSMSNGIVLPAFYY